MITGVTRGVGDIGSTTIDGELEVLDTVINNVTGLLDKTIGQITDEIKNIVDEIAKI
ncbi:MAG: hypothetical protein HQK54_16545 [Oligoflexales bacterium]|nr:hypothetical protein [Oligoflexales bacterium]